MTRTPLPPPDLLPSTGGLPVLLSVPHSGTHYPDWLLRDARRGRRSLEPLEDPLVDRLVWRAAALGCGAVIARTPRAAIDCNRSLKEVDSSVVAIAPPLDPGPRARGGLGLVPGRTPRDGDLWRRRIDQDELERRVGEAWRPFHDAIRAGLQSLKEKFGCALLLDCHSMPPRGASLPQVVLGDRYGRSTDAWLADLARSTVEREGEPAAFNDPYAGGWIVDHHGRPDRGIHALQVEFDRNLYLAPDGRTPSASFDRAARLLESLARTLGQALLDRHAPVREAAE